MTNLRWYQYNLVEGVIEAFDEGLTRVLAVLPCGGGKTHTAVSICAPYKRILWIAHRHRLLDQAREAFSKVGKNDVVFHSLYKDPDPTWPKFDLVVLDEAHHESCKTARYLIDSISFDRLLGLTATPDRDDNAILFFDTQVIGISLDELVHQGFLCEPWVITVRCKLDIIQSLSSWMNSLTEGELGPSIVFTTTIEEAKQFKNNLKFSSTIVTADSDRVGQLAAYRDGDVQVLLSCLILTEGVDLPCTKTAVIARNVQSKTMLTQMVGRAMRSHPSKQHCNLVEGVYYKGKHKLSITEIVNPTKRLLATRTRQVWVLKELCQK